MEIRVRIRLRLRVALISHFSRRITKTSTLSSANFTEGNILLKERNQTINNNIKLHILYYLDFGLCTHTRDPTPKARVPLFLLG